MHTYTLLAVLEQMDCFNLKILRHLLMMKSIRTSGITISLIERPEGGKFAETTEAIKFSAPKFYSAFGRAVSTQDYEAIIPNIYPNVASIACYGGEEAEPPNLEKYFWQLNQKMQINYLFLRKMSF